MEQPGITLDAGPKQSSGRIVAVGLLLIFLGLGLWAQRSVKSHSEDSRKVLQITRIQNDSLRSRLALQRYLLSGDTREIDSVHRLSSDVESKLNQLRAEKTTSPAIGAILKRLIEVQEQWTEQFAEPLIKKRQTFDEGKGTLPDLQIQYLMTDPIGWDRNFDDQYDYVIKSLEEKE
jgi:CHASE3 domain sensor protein